MTPVDPIVRISLWLEFLRREKRLVIALLVTALIVASAFVGIGGEVEQPFSKAELEQMGDLPLAPDGAPPPEPSEAERQQLRELSEKLEEQKKAP